MRLQKIKLLLVVVVATLLSDCTDQSQNRQTYILTTGTTGGTFYPVGVAYRR